MGEWVWYGFGTKDLQDSIWPHLVVSVLWKFRFALFETSPSSQVAIVRACVEDSIGNEQVRTKTCNSCSKRCKAEYEA